jgi:hypothetical protein
MMTRVVEDIGSRNLANMAVTEVGACDVSRGRVKLKVYEVLAEVFSSWTYVEILASRFFRDSLLAAIFGSICPQKFLPTNTM